MPQLDILIAFPQIIWFIFIFIIFYFLLTFYFLPFFLKSIKSKKLFIEKNSLNNLKIIDDIYYKHKKNSILLNSHFKSLKQNFFLPFINFNYIKKNSFRDLLILTLNSSKQITIYCNNIIFNYITFYPNNLNLKKFKKN